MAWEVLWKDYNEIDGTVETEFVTNRIKLNYSPLANTLLGLHDPIQLYRGDVVYDAESYFDGKESI